MAISEGELSIIAISQEAEAYLRVSNPRVEPEVWEKGVPVGLEQSEHQPDLEKYPRVVLFRLHDRYAAFRITPQGSLAFGSALRNGHTTPAAIIDEIFDDTNYRLGNAAWIEVDPEKGIQVKGKVGSFPTQNNLRPHLAAIEHTLNNPFPR